MAKVWLVLKHEFFRIVFRKSFMLTLVGIPLVGFIIILVVGQLNQSAPEAGGDLITDIFNPKPEMQVEGYVDQSGIIRFQPFGQEKVLRSYESEEDARKALEAGEITAFYIIAPDYLQSGEVVYYRPDFNPLGGMETAFTIRYAINYNLMGRNDRLFSLYLAPTAMLAEEYLTDETQREVGNFATFIVPYIVTLVYYIIILGASSMLLNSLAAEKQNRVIELIVTSAKPMHMLAGKTIALGLVGLLQTIFWVGGGYLLLKISGNTFSLPIGLDLPPSFLLWAVVFFLLGYALYATIMAGLGALVPSLREAQQASTVVVLPMVVPLVFITVLIEDPNGPISQFLSLFPLTSPVAMMTRLAGGEVEIWQLGVSILLLLVSSYIAVRIAARLFRAQNLLSGQSFHLKVWLRAIFSRG